MPKCVCEKKSGERGNAGNTQCFRGFQRGYVFPTQKTGEQ